MMAFFKLTVHELNLGLSSLCMIKRKKRKKLKRKVISAFRVHNHHKEPQLENQKAIQTV